MAKVAFEYNGDLTVETYKKFYQYGNFEELPEDQLEWQLGILVADEDLRDHGSRPAAEKFADMERRLRNAPLRFDRLAFVHGIDDNRHDAHDEIDDEIGGREFAEDKRGECKRSQKNSGEKQIEMFL